MNQEMDSAGGGSGTFVVCVHDVSPRKERAVVQQLAALRPLLGATVSAAVVPAATGASWGTAGPELRQALQPVERLLHGFSHCRPRSMSLLSHLSGRCDEFAGLSPAEAGRRLSDGQMVMAEVFGRTADGFLPPAWRRGSIGAGTLARGRMSFLVDYGAVESVSGRRIPLATYSWDWGPASLLGRLGSAAGRLCALRAGAVNVIALHPEDAARGYLSPALDMIRRFLDRGFIPARFAELLEKAS
jgi:hypothetical protein